MKSKKIRCDIYTRVSTTMQVDGYSLDAQKEKLKRYAEFQNMEIVNEYSDEGKSGKSVEGRPEFQRMVDNIENGTDEVQFVLVFKLSRFGCNAADVLNSLQRMQDFGVNLICVEDGIDSSKDSGKLMISVLSAMAEIERENILVQTMEGRKQKAREGKWNGGFDPYGYELVNGELQIAEDEAKIIRLIYDKFIHTNMGIFMVTGLLIFLPALYFFYFEFSNVPLKERVWVSLFQSVTPRTAGFNTADLTLLSEVGQMLIIMLMLIGGSPGSTAGGMKTTTLAVLVSSALSVFRKKEHTHFFGRQIPDGTIRNAATIFLMYIVLFLAGGMVISSIEDIPLMTALFETASAIGTVGLSLGITPDLGIVSHIILICLMFFGRVGGLTLIFATISEKKSNGSKYPQEKITVG